MIADNDESSREILLSFFGKKNCLGECAAEGTRAMHKLKTFIPDILLLDLKMPNISGEEV